MALIAGNIKHVIRISHAACAPHTKNNKENLRPFSNGHERGKIGIKFSPKSGSPFVYRRQPHSTHPLCARISVRPAASRRAHIRQSADRPLINSVHGVRARKIANLNSDEASPRRRLSRFPFFFFCCCSLSLRDGIVTADTCRVAVRRLNIRLLSVRPRFPLFR